MLKAEFKKKLTEVLASETFALAMKRGLANYRKAMQSGINEEEFAKLREELKSCKDTALARLPQLIEQFTEEAKAASATVHFAETAEKACEIITGIAESHDAKLIVKSKSMVSEEIELNSSLQEKGIEVVETDLGEWIVQLAGEHPSHMLAPAIHKTRDDIAELFAKTLGQKIPADVDKLVKAARPALRQKFINADIGISGANIGIAESGTIVIVTNEGNGMLTTTLPPVHIALLGVERIVPTLEDAMLVLKMLPRQANGLKLSVYTSFITGPSYTSNISSLAGIYGPREVHIVLLDNGRLAMLRDPIFKEALRCIRCAACLNVCPTFEAVGPVFGHLYMGPIGMPLTLFHHGMEFASDPSTLCTQCGACEKVCAVGIDLPKLVVEVRRRILEKEGMSMPKKAMIYTLSRPKTAERLAGIVSKVQGAFGGNSGYIKIPMTNKNRNVPAFSSRPFRKRLAELQSSDISLETKVKGATAVFYPGCVADFVFPEIAENAVSVLQACGVKVVYPPQWPCCGVPSIVSGDKEGAIKMACQAISALDSSLADYIVSPCPSCIAALVHDYPLLFEENHDWKAKAEAVRKRAIDFTSFIDRVAQLPANSLADHFPKISVTYQNTCHSVNMLGIKTNPQRLLEDVMGLELREMSESDVCCGFGGYFSFQNPEVAKRIAERKIKNILATGASVLISDNPGCILHLRGNLKSENQNVRVLHVAELMSARLKDKQTR